MCYNWNNLQILYFQRFVFNYSGIWLACKGEFSLLIYPSWRPGQKILCSLFLRAHFSAKCGACSLPRKVGGLPFLTSSHQKTKALNVPKSSEPARTSHFDESRLLILSPIDFIVCSASSVLQSVSQGVLGTYGNVWSLKATGESCKCPDSSVWGLSTSTLSVSSLTPCFFSVFSFTLFSNKCNYLFTFVKLR